MYNDFSFICGTISSLVILGTAEYVYTHNAVDSAPSLYANVIGFPVVLLHEASHYIVAELLGQRVERACLRFNSDMGAGTVNGPYVETRWTSWTAAALSATAPITLMGPLAAYMLLAQPLATGWMNGLVGVSALFAVVATSATDLSLFRKGRKALGMLGLSLGLLVVGTAALVTTPDVGGVSSVMSGLMGTLAKLF